MRNPEYILAFLCALTRLAVCCWRAVHQAVIVDEATTYNHFVSGPWRQLFGRYDANNHILSSILIKVSVTLGHLSPFMLRLPSLMGGFALALGVFWLLKHVESWLFRWAAFALVCLHPLLLDLSIAARGYSISLAFFVWGLYFAWERRYVWAGVLLGLAIAANLTIMFPVLAVLVVMIVVDRKAFFYITVPTILIGGMINYPSLRRAHREDFYAGFPDLRTAVTSFFVTTFHAIPARDGILGGGRTPELVGLYGLPLLLVLMAAATFRLPGRRRIPFFVLALTLLGLVLARWLAGVDYPPDRACLYFVILAALAWAMAADALTNRLLKALWLIPAMLVILQFCTQLQTRCFQFWRSEADDELIARRIQQDCAGKPDGSVEISTSWIHQPTLEFYRRCYHITALKPVRRLEPPPLTGFDFYVLSGEDFARGQALRAVFTDRDLPVLLAEP